MLSWFHEVVQGGELVWGILDYSSVCSNLLYLFEKETTKKQYSLFVLTRCGQICGWCFYTFASANAEGLLSFFCYSEQWGRSIACPCCDGLSQGTMVGSQGCLLPAWCCWLLTQCVTSGSGPVALEQLAAGWVGFTSPGYGRLGVPVLLPSVPCFVLEAGRTSVSRPQASEER